MSLLNILRQRASCRPLSLPTTRHVISRLTRPQQWATPKTFTPSFTRLASDAATVARTPPAYASQINIFRAGTPITLFVGFLRIITLVVFGTGTFILAPNYAFSPDHSILWVPALILGSLVPVSVAVFATGPLVHAITVQLPLSARRSQAGLKAFSAATPPETVLRLHYMKLAPWFTTKEVQFGRLRRLRPSLGGGVANLEYVPEHVEGKEGSIWFWLVQGFWGRYYVKRDQANDRAAVPGVLNLMWEQIPRKGEEGDPLVKGSEKREKRAVVERRVVRMSGRPGGVSGKGEIVPPPPAPVARSKQDV